MILGLGEAGSLYGNFLRLDSAVLPSANPWTEWEPAVNLRFIHGMARELRIGS